MHTLLQTYCTFMAVRSPILAIAITATQVIAPMRTIWLGVLIVAAREAQETCNGVGSKCNPC